MSSSLSSCFLAANRRSWTKPLLPKLSTLVHCCLRWVALHLQAFCMLLATHHHHIIVVPSLLTNCHCPIAVLEMPLLSSLTSSLSATAAASTPSLLPLPSPSLPPPLLSLPSSSTMLQQRCFVIVVIVVLFGGQS
jgi:hypothetical protein